MADYHVRRSRMPSTNSDDFEDESLDPRIQIELEKLNKASEEINRLELELDDARASFRQTLSESTQKLDVLAKKLGSCVEKARPYYDARVKAKEAHLETQRAALRFERACSMHEAAKEMVQLAEQGYMRREQPSDPAWQEMLNHATMKVNEAEKERNESEQEHERTMIRFKQSEDQVQGLQKDLKRAITKSKPYFEMKARFNQIMEEHKHKVSMLEEDVGSAKSLYSTALRSLEAISDEIHRQRLERRQQQQLGVRGAGVGAECPLPPPSWEKGGSLEGRGSYQSLDPLGVIKISSSLAYGSAPVSSQARTRNLSGESAHEKEMEEENVQSRERSGVGDEDAAACPVPKESEDGQTSQSEREETGGKEAEARSPVCSPVSSPKVLIPGDPLGVIPPMYTSRSGTHQAKTSSSSSSSISHPAFAGAVTSNPHPGRSAPVTHPFISAAAAGTMSGGSRTKSVTSMPEAFVSPSVVYASPGQARRPSYRRAVEASEKSAEEPEEGVAMGSSEEERSQVFEACETRQRSYSSPVEPDPRTRSPPHAIPARVSGGQEVLADGRKHGSAPEQSAILTAVGEGGVGMEESPAAMRRRQKLQGLILRIDPSMDPLRHFQPPAKTPPPPGRGGLQKAASLSAQVPTPSPAAPPTPALGEKETLTPTPTHPTPPWRPCGPTASVSDYAISKPIIRSASSVSNTGSERSETEFSEVESVSATQSPTKPRARLLNVPTSIETVEDSSDTESLASTGPMLDDEQVEFLTMDFSDMTFDRDEAHTSATLPSHWKRNSWSRMSLPPRLSYLEEFLAHAKRNSGEFDSWPPECAECTKEGEGSACEEGVAAPHSDGALSGGGCGSNTARCAEQGSGTRDEDSSGGDCAACDQGEDSGESPVVADSMENPSGEGEGTAIPTTVGVQ